MISNVVSVRNENHEGVSAGSALLGYLKLLNFQLDATTNTYELSKMRQKSPTKYLAAIESIYNLLKT
jgi:hypothetical protein